MKSFLSKRAARAAERIDARWKRDADDPGIFAREFLATIEILESSSSLGTSFPTAKHPALKRLLMRKSRCHLYFEIDDANQTIQILHIWDGLSEDEWEAAWSSELDRRAREVRSGAVALVDGDEALAQVRRSLASRRP